jgi:hypothetical protein
MQTVAREAQATCCVGNLYLNACGLRPICFCGSAISENCHIRLRNCVSLASPVTERLMIQLSVNDELERMWKEAGAA